jgi:putative endonuclease
MEYCVYILHSETLSRFYTGYTSNFDLRIEFHQNPDSRKFTYNAKDWKPFLKINCISQKQAIAIEKHIKKMKSAVYIQNLKKYPEMIARLREKYRQ